MNDTLCPNCGSPVIVGGSYCFNCGHRLVSGETPAAPATSRQRDETPEAPEGSSAASPVRLVQSPWLARPVPASDEQVSAPRAPQAAPAAATQPASSSVAPLATTSSSVNTRLTPQRTSQGGIVWATVGGAAATLSFFVLPYVNLGLLGSATGVQTASALNTLYSAASQACGQLGSSGPSSSCNQGPNLAVLLWVQVACAAIAVITAGLAWLGSQQNGASVSHGASAIVFIAGSVGTLAMFLPLLGLRSSAGVQLISSVVGIGYWVMVIGLITAAIGAIAQLRA